MNNFHDDDSNVSSRAGTYSIQFDSDMSHKNFQADMTNPNLYHSIDDHVYDEIKNKDGYKDLGKLSKIMNFTNKYTNCKNLLELQTPSLIKWIKEKDTEKIQNSENKLENLGKSSEANFVSF